MINYMKLLSALFLTLVLIGTAFAGTSRSVQQDFVTIRQVDVNGVTADETGVESVFVERGSNAIVEVWFTGNSNSNQTRDRVRVEARISGYEHGTIREETDIFEVIPNVKYRKVLVLEIPEDIDANSNNDSYTLIVEVFDDEDSEDASAPLKVKEKRHSLNILDVNFNPSLNVEAGKLLFTNVRVENLGDKKEEDIKVSVKIPELGLEAHDFIDELAAHEVPDEDEEDSAETDDIFLRIPDNTNSGNYALVVEVEFNRGHDTVQEKFVLSVKATSAVEPGPSGVTVQLDSTSKEVKQGEGAVYKIMLVNLEQTPLVFTADVNGEESFAISRVDPAVLTLQPNQAGEMFVFVSAREDASTGLHSFTIDVKANGATVKTLTAQSDVKEKSFGFGNVNSVLALVFIVLIAIVIILAIVLAATKLGKGGEEEALEEGKTYY